MTQGLGKLVAATVLLAAMLAGLGGCVQPDRYNTQAAVDHYVRGRLAAERGDVNAALRELALAVKNDPTLSVAYSAAGDIHRQQGDYAAAADSYAEACKTNPYSFRPHYNLGVTYQMLAETSGRAGNYLAKAIDVYLRAVVIKPDDYDANLNLAACYFQTGKYDRAEQYGKAAVALRPDSPEAHCNLGVIYDSQGKVYDAIREYNRSLEINTNQPRLLMNLGSTYLRQKRFNDALRTYQQAANQQPADPVAWEQIGGCYYHMKQYDQARQSYEKSLAIDSSSAVARRGLGVTLMTQYVIEPKRPELRDAALENWHRSLEIKPDQPDLVKLVKKYTPPPAEPAL